MFVRNKSGIFEVEKRKIWCADINDYVEKDVIIKNGENVMALNVFEELTSKVIKESENISDLVDGYWIELEKYTDPIFKPNRHIVNDILNKWIESDKETKTDSVKTLTVYGSIYIRGKGWTHVSKVYVENGEIKEELLYAKGM